MNSLGGLKQTTPSASAPQVQYEDNNTYWPCKVGYKDYIKVGQMKHFQEAPYTCIINYQDALKFF